MAAMRMIAGLDIGNGYVKASVMAHGGGMTDVDMPSCVAHWLPKDGDVRRSAPADVAEEVAGIFDQMNVSFDSPAIEDKERFLVGARAVTCGRVPVQFDLNGVRSKSEQALTFQLALASIAGKALQDAYVAAGNRIPDGTIGVDVVAAAMALPITEYKDKEIRKNYAKAYTDNVHVVTFHNFVQDVRVEIRFQNVMVNAEGAAAQLGIVSKGPDMVEAMLQDVRLHGVELADITANDVISATSTLGVDIGEGTVNFPVFINGRFSTDASSTMLTGYGKVMEDALEELIKQKKPYKSRKELTEFLNNPPMNKTSVIYRKRYESIQKVVDGEIAGFVDSVVNEFTKVMNRTGAQIEVIYVYGGGASPMQRELFPKLLKALQVFDGAEIITPVLYMDSRYSRNLNREGLFAMAEAMAAKSAGKG